MSSRLDGAAADLVEQRRRHTQERFDDCRIEVRAGAARDLGLGRVERDRLRIRAIEGHRVEGIDDGKDTRSEWDVLAPEAARVAAAVPLLVMRIDDGYGAAQEGDPLD